ncbi:adenosylmethionine--8-amino-7-oxononanoate transaminase [Aeromicrobium sp.]|uniref:adenosylmethionine--8-amino-7-oxononanoate transaminase n=1 Tax=Aeromicrobium sp. TaxID=1871063 RepID=UPI0019BD8FEC|nr:adenosylmethionine--8-amino-7-oxononanoate transaminase [Aeromicrobium sp.]MBC7632082.1 adenosylmethionine--8-amino-7-oxononanoate transaminase [Aeromicrobium sp.]
MDDLLEYDRRHVWHPYAAIPPVHGPLLVRSARGARLELADGRRPIDAMSSWWSAIHGYRHPALDAAAHAQVDVMSHVMFGGLTHEPAIGLARRLVDMSPPGLEHVFFADSGSVCVEVAIKMALQHQRGLGHTGRTRIATPSGGYHGDTFGAMSVCDPVGGMHTMFADVLAPQVFLPRPPAGLGADIAEWAAAAAEVLDAASEQIAAIIIEPVLQGAGGMHVYPPAVVTWLRERADDLGVLLVVDEIATGFGRTGEMFASDHASVSPDIMCVGKALTGGYMTLAAVVCTPAVAAGIAASESGVLVHGPTFMANPLACAVATASLDLLAGGDWRSDVLRIGAALSRGLAPAADLERVVDVRTIGAVGVIQLDRPVDVRRVSAVALDHGVWVRPFRDLIYTMPPYVCGDDELDTITAALVAAAASKECR